jgi:kynurenine formamidase
VIITNARAVAIEGDQDVVPVVSGAATAALKDLLRMAEGTGAATSSPATASLFVTPLPWDLSAPMHGVSNVDAIAREMTSTVWLAPGRWKLLAECSHPIRPTSPFYVGGHAALFHCPLRGARIGGQKAPATAATAATEFPQTAAASHQGGCCDKVPLVITTGCGVGTHCDSPRHFFPDGRSIDLLTGAELLAPAVVVDIAARAAQDDEATVTVADLVAWEEQHGRRIPPGALVCMRSGWSTRFAAQDPAAGAPVGAARSAPAAPINHPYLNNAPRADSAPDCPMRFPYFSTAAVEWLLRERPDFGGLGVDTLSPDAGDSAAFPVHDAVLGASKYHVENMALEALSASGTVSDASRSASVYFVTAPWAVRDGFEAQCRCVAVLRE